MLSFLRASLAQTSFFLQLVASEAFHRAFPNGRVFLQQLWIRVHLEPASRHWLSSCSAPCFTALPWEQLPMMTRSGAHAAQLWAEAAAQLQRFASFLAKASRFCGHDDEQQRRLLATAAFYLDFVACLRAADAATVPQIRSIFAARLPRLECGSSSLSAISDDACQAIHRTLAAEQDACSSLSPTSRCAALQDLLVIDVWSTLSYRRERATLVAAALGWLLLECVRSLTGPQQRHRQAAALRGLLQEGVAAFETGLAPRWVAPLAAMSLGLPGLPKPRSKAP